MATGRARIAVSILDADHSNLGYAVRRAEKEGADRIHIDVMDGHFVPNLTFGPKMIAGLRKRTELPLDAHLMISNPLKYIDEFLDAGCDSVTFHVEVPAEADRADDREDPCEGPCRRPGRQAEDAAVRARAVPADARHHPRDDRRARVRRPGVHDATWRRRSSSPPAST